MRKFAAKISGRCLLMHSVRLANPVDEYSKAIKTITRKPTKEKGDSDHEEVWRLEYQGGLWYDDDGLGPVIPGDALNALMAQGASKIRKGKAFAATIYCDEESFALEYEGPRDREGLWNDPRFRDYRGVVVGKSKVMRTRPRFRNWSVRFSFVVGDDSLNRKDIELALTTAGQLVGLGDYRPRYGTFVVNEFEQVD